MSTRKDQILRKMAGQKGRSVALTREEKALRAVLERLNEGGIGGGSGGVTVNVMSFGAKGDGTTDDSVAIQSALDYSRDRGGAVYFPRGTYNLVTKNHTVGQSDMGLKVYDHQTLIGDHAVLMVAADAEFRNTMTLYNEDAATGYDGISKVHIEGLTFDSARKENHTHLRTTHATDVTIKNCVFKNCYGWHNIECNSSKRVKIVGCNFLPYISATSVSEHIQLDAATGNGDLGVHDGTVCQDIEICDCYFEVTNHPAIGNHSGKPHNHVKIHNNVFTGGTSSRGYIDFYEGAYSFNIYDNTFYDGSLGVVMATVSENNIVHENDFVNVLTPFNANVIAYNNIVDGFFMASEESEREWEVLYTLDDFEAGFINKSTGAVETNDSFPNAIVSPVIDLEVGKTYVFTSDITGSANDQGHRIRIYDEEGVFKLAIDGTKLDNTYTTINTNSSNVYLATNVTIVPKIACKIRLNFLDSTLVTWAKVSV